MLCHIESASISHAGLREGLRFRNLPANNLSTGLKMKFFRRLQRSLLVALTVLPFVVASLHAQTKPSPNSNASYSEHRADLGLVVAKSSPLALRVWLRNMPKGGDLHNHIFGAVYAETWIKDAVDDHMCVDT